MANRAQELAESRAYKAANKKRLQQKNAAWYKANPGYNRFARSLRRAAEKRATPAWADKAKMQAIYARAVLRTKVTGVPHEVDHVYPLQSAWVCGLHCEANLRVITSRANRSKRNRPPTGARRTPG